MATFLDDLKEPSPGLQKASPEIGGESQSQGALEAVFAGLVEGGKAFGRGLGTAWDAIEPEATRLGTQGAMELANALFGGSAFTIYGPGQYTPDPGQQKQGQEHQQELGREM